MNRDHDTLSYHRCPLIQRDPVTRTGQHAGKQETSRMNPGRDDFAAQSHRVSCPESLSSPTLSSLRTLLCLLSRSETLGLTSSYL